MGKPSPEQIDDTIDHGIAAGRTADEIIDELSTLSRLSDEEMAERGIFPVPLPQEPKPRPKRSIMPDDNGPPAASYLTPPTPADEVPPLTPPAFAHARVRERSDGWTADRQRRFIAALAETGCVSEACAEVGLTPRSAYRLREHAAAGGFRDAWRHAEAMASVRLVAIAFDRAIHGSVEKLYKDGELVAERRKPSDRLLMWLLSHHDPETYGWLAKPIPGGVHPSFYPLHHARKNMGSALASLADVSSEECPTDWVGGSDYAIDEGRSDHS